MFRAGLPFTLSQQADVHWTGDAPEDQSDGGWHSAVAEAPPSAVVPALESVSREGILDDARHQFRASLLLSTARCR